MAPPGSLDGVIVGLSGGKDSLVTLDLCCAKYRRVVAMFWYFVQGIQCVESVIEWAVSKYGVELLRFPHPTVYRAHHDGLFAARREEASRLHLVKQVDIEALARDQTGIEWTAYGHRMSDSLHRRAMLKSLRGVDEMAKRLYPIWDWPTCSVRSYLRAKKIPTPSVIGGQRSGGISLEPAVVLWLYDNARDDYERVRAVFPLVESCIKRRDFQRERAALRDGALAPIEDPERPIQPS